MQKGGQALKTPPMSAMAEFHHLQRVSRFASGHAYEELLFVLSGVTPALPGVNVKRVALEDNPCFVAE
jgi:hypothetical protein